jgi:hypothetical protein
VLWVNGMELNNNGHEHKNAGMEKNFEKLYELD